MSKLRPLHGRALVCAAAVALSLAACGDGKKTDAASSAEPESSAAAKKPAAKGDPAIVAELKKLSACKREDGWRERDCEAAKGWDDYTRKLTEEYDEQRTAEKKIAAACVELLGDGNDSVREAAFDCMSDHTEVVVDPKSVIELVLAKVSTESSEGVRSAMFRALRSLDPTKHGLAPKVIEMAKPMVDDKSGKTPLSALVDALAPSSRGVEAAPESVAFAIELVEKDRLTKDAVRVLSATKAKSKEACDALAKLVEQRAHSWGHGLHGMGNIEGSCKEHAGRVAEVIVTRAGEGDGHNKGIIGAYLIYLQRLAEKGIFDDGQKAKMRTALEAAAKDPKLKDHQKENFEKTIAAMK